MNWTECEKEIERLIWQEIRLCQTDAGTVDETFVFSLKSEIASFINQHFGLEPDKVTVTGAGGEHYCEEVIQTEDHGREGVEKIKCGKPARDSFNGRFLCPEHLKLTQHRWKAKGGRFMSEPVTET